MEKMLIKDFPETGTLELYMLLKEITDKEARNGSKYIMVTLSDGKQDIKANRWDTTKATCGFDTTNVIVAVTLEISIYNAKPSYTVRKMRGLSDDDNVDINEFVASAPKGGEELYNACMDMAYSITDPELMQVVTALFEENREKLLTWGAAKSVHHNVRSGLLWHIYRMGLNAQKFCEVYTTLNRDMLLAGVLLHDIGKLTELETDFFGTSEYTMEGSLFGHLFIGARMVEDKCRAFGVSDSTKHQLMHAIVSHHGKLEYGAIAQPATPEAMMVHLIDDADARMYIFENVYENMESGEFSDRQLGLDHARAYKF